MPGDHRSVTEQTLRLSAEEAQEMAHELDDVVQAWARRTRGRDPERRTYLLLSILQPHPGTTQAPPGTTQAPSTPQDQPATP